MYKLKLLINPTLYKISYSADKYNVQFELEWLCRAKNVHIQCKARWYKITNATAERQGIKKNDDRQKQRAPHHSDPTVM